jgi:hypothetical protein
MSKSHHKPTMQLVPSNSKNPNKPIRYEHLRPGSYFRIFAEPSRGIRTSNDQRIYQRAHDHEGFFSFHIASPTPCILMPNDLVVPYRMVPLKHD